MDGVGSSGVLISEKRWEWHGEKEMGARKANGMSTGDEAVLKTGRGRRLGLFYSYKKEDAEQRENSSHPGNHFLFEPFFAGATLQLEGVGPPRRAVAPVSPSQMPLSSLPGVHCASLLRVFFFPTATRKGRTAGGRVLCRSWRRVRIYDWRPLYVF
jgi:hypothetical protein